MRLILLSFAAAVVSEPGQLAGQGQILDSVGQLLVGEEPDLDAPGEGHFVEGGEQDALADTAQVIAEGIR